MEETKQQSTFLSNVVRWGLITGGVSIVFSIVLYVIDYTLMVQLKVLFIALAIYLGLAIYGGIDYRKSIGGFISYGKAFQHGFLILAISALVATLAPFARVSAGTLVGTVKIITYAVPQAALAQAEALAQRAIRVQPVVRRSAGLLMTDVPGQQDRLIAKGRRAVEARLRALGMTLAGVATVLHETDAMAKALANLPGEMLLILTGSATSDPCDTAPQAVRAAGGTVLRFGMPVDPGNLLFHGHLGSRPVIGLPGCARSLALNGADWVLERLACGLTLTYDDIAAMGVGGLLKEIAVRPQPREAQQGRPTHG